MFFDAFLTKTFYQKSVLEKSEMRCTLRFQAGSEVLTHLNVWEKLIVTVDITTKKCYVGV